MSDLFYNSLLTSICTIKHRVYNGSSTDSWGIPQETVNTVSSNEPCLIQQNNETIEFTVRGKKEIATHLGFFKSDANIYLDDIVEINGVSYQVIGIDDVMQQGHHKEVALKKIEDS